MECRFLIKAVLQTEGLIFWWLCANGSSSLAAGSQLKMVLTWQNIKRETEETFPSSRSNKWSFIFTTLFVCVESGGREHVLVVCRITDNE